jgi:hypothetical protein
LLQENARRKTVRIWAEQAPFDLKDELKKRGYRWSSGDEGRPKAWYIDIDEAKRDHEIAYLQQSFICATSSCSYKPSPRSIAFRSEFSLLPAPAKRGAARNS